MAYRVVYEVDGACRGNGRPRSIAVAAAVRYDGRGRRQAWKRHLPRSFPTPTNQRAELTAIILAAELELEHLQEPSRVPDFAVHIKSDSDYAVKCLTVWCKRWIDNGWVAANGADVLNRDLIEEALDLINQLQDKVEVTLDRVPREQVSLADGYCNEALDEM